ncbi:hypothetical protein [Alienimonas californiensis]|uniref:Uncharacterized protein n=1 Tax=Alienimonas californiensis TaxID=2527989 RepID=A0A517PCB9_9PLAN|nr:hypothetical protein [Alienimonas californiensis]QDT17024.1 hypothetical protein CA12_31350 [Alienimonas californiensis]
MNASSEEASRWQIVRFFAYVLAAGLAVQALYQLVVARGPSIAEENGLLELSQVGVAVIGGATLAAAAAFARRGRTALALCSGALLYAAARESDLWIERVAFEDAYKYLAGGPIAAAVALVAWRDRRWWAESFQWANHPAAGLLLCGGLQILVVAALFDRSDLWDSVTNVHQADPMKRLVEESIELSGYLALAIGALELFVTCRREYAAAFETELAVERVPARPLVLHAPSGERRRLAA